ncbi:putative deacetylase LmbE-like domain-containing protein [Blastocladiella britannica]|nr:putative deacetylase LmbE-like domain-containing protein [Blastocladiella britannica]
MFSWVISYASSEPGLLLAVVVAIVAALIARHWFAPPSYPALAWSKNSPSWKSSDPPPFSPSADRVLLVTAHPDDECMFFAPTCLALTDAGVPLHLLCLSTGNADGLGTVRERELRTSAKILRIPAENMAVVNSLSLQDGMKAVWPAAEIVKRVKDVVKRDGITQIVTFDNGGVSGHPNHIAISRALQSDASLGKITWHLYSVPSVVAKYLPFSLDAFRTLTSGSSRPRDHYQLGTTGSVRQSATDEVVWRVVSRPAQIERAKTAMRAHASQMVWFRYLYIKVSRYMAVNELVKTTTRLGKVTQ